MQNLWVFSFEYAGIIKVGGLGEVPANQTKWLANQYNITLFMPSHGVHAKPEIIEKLNLQKLDVEAKLPLNALRIGLGDTSEEVQIEFHKGTINGITVIMMVGKNDFSSKILNDPIVYSPESLTGKFVLFSLGMKFFIHHTLHKRPNDLPHIIHCHDHHGVPALICCRQSLIKEKRDVPTIVTIHLMSWPRMSLDFFLTCGVENTEFDVFVGGEHKTYDFKQFYRLCKGSEALEPTLEKIGVFFADLVTSVSEDYALSNVVGNLGGGWIYPKTDFTWNGCDWDYNSMVDSVKNTFEQELKALESREDEWYSRNNLRKFLLTRGFSQMSEAEPIIPSKKVQAYLEDGLTFFPFVKDKDGVYRGKLANFYEDGPLIITTGRVSKQKGIDVLLDAIPLVLKKHPDSKFILSVLPTEFSIPDIESYLGRIKMFKNNVRMIFGKVFSLFFLMHLAADIYCAPSRWEPFGITALEASISKDIVVASQTGGLQEIVLDVGKAKAKATGLLVHVEEVEMLANAISDLIAIIKIEQLSESSLKSDEELTKKLIKSILNPDVKKMVKKYPDYATRLRENAYNRVINEFRWKKVTQKLPKLYNQALINRGNSM